jgi:aromatic-amino-acid transaminase
MSSLFAAVEMAPRDPILGLNEAFNADTNPNKVNLGVGVYFGDDGKIPLLGAVKAAEKVRLETQPPRGYQPIEGIPAYNNAVQNLLFGKDSDCSPPAAPSPANAWAAPARSRSAPTT